MWIRKLKARKLQSVIICLLILICTLLITGSMEIMISLSGPYTELIEETNAPKIRAYPKFSMGETRDWIKELSALEHVESVLEVQRYYILDQPEINGRRMDAFLSLVESQGNQYENIRIIEGENSPKEKECLIPKMIADGNDIQIGDILKIIRDDQVYEYKVVGFYAFPYSLNAAFESEILVKKIPDELIKDSYYAIYMDEEGNTKELVDQYLKQKEGIWDVYFLSVDEAISNAALTENILGAILLILSIIVFFVICIMIKYMVRDTIIRDKKTVGIYKTIGYTNKMIVCIYMKYYISLTLTGSIIGVFLAPILSNTFIKAAMDGIGNFSINKNYIISLICLGVINGLAIINVIRELNKIKKMDPVDMMNETGTKQKIKVLKKNQKLSQIPRSKLRDMKLAGAASCGVFDPRGIRQMQECKHSCAWLIARGNKISFSPINMAIRMIGRDKKNTIAIIVTCILSIFMANTALACFFNMDDMKRNNYYWLGFDKYDISLEASGDPDKFTDLCEEIRKHQDVENLIMTNMERSYCIAWAQSGSGIVYENYEGIDMPVVEGRNPRYSDEIVISNLYAEELSKKPGDYIEVYIDPDTKVNMMIVGICQSYYNLGRSLRLMGNIFKEHNVEFHYTSASVYLNKGIDEEAFIKEIREQYPQIKVEKRENMYNHIVDKINNPQKTALKPFTFLVVLVGCLNIIYVIYLKNLSNRRKNCIYKVVGYRVGHLNKANLWYVGMIGALSIFIAVPVFILAFPQIMKIAMSMFGFAEYRVAYDPMIMTAANGGLLVLFMISTLISSKELYKNHISEFIQE